MHVSSTTFFLKGNERYGNDSPFERIFLFYKKQVKKNNRFPLPV